MEGSSEYTKQAVTGSRQGVVLHLGDWMGDEEHIIVRKYHFMQRETAKPNERPLASQERYVALWN
jgi:hypothetical protein